MHFPKRYADLVARLRVPFGFLLVGAFVFLARPSMKSLCVGMPISIAGLSLRAWAAGHLAKNQNLARSGPYAYCRNPLYIGTLLVAAGLAAASRSAPLGILFTVVFALVYLPVIELEEQHLRKLFPEYTVYAAHVPALVPKWGPRATRGSPAWNPKMYWKNQEYQALAGFLAGAAWLLWLTWLSSR